METNNGVTATGPDATAGHARDDVTIATLAAELTAHQQRLEEIERSLVERIADVDDDRRRTAVLLQRARQGQEEEVAEQLRRQSGAHLRAILGLALFVIVAFGLFYWHTDSRLRALSNEVAALEHGQAQAQAGQTARATLDDEIPKRLVALSATVAEIAASVARIDERATAEIAPLAATLERLEEKQQQAATALARLNEEQQQVASETDALLRRLTETEAQAWQEPERSPADEVSSDHATEAATTRPGDEIGPDEPAARPDTARGDPAASRDPGSSAAPTPADTPAPTTDTTARGKETEPTAAPPQAPTDLTRAAQTDDQAIQVGDRPYALQLIGYFNTESLRAFAGRDDLPDRMYYREETHRGRPWYVLIHSLHRSDEEAAAALAGLSEELLALEPLVRRLPDDAVLRVLEP